MRADGSVHDAGWSLRILFQGKDQPKIIQTILEDSKNRNSSLVISFYKAKKAFTPKSDINTTRKKNYKLISYGIKTL